MFEFGDVVHFGTNVGTIQRQTANKYLVYPDFIYQHNFSTEFVECDESELSLWEHNAITRIPGYHFIQWNKIPQQATIIDVGASDCGTCVAMLKKRPKANIFAYEADVRSVLKIDDPRIIMNVKAVVGDKYTTNGCTELHLFPVSGRTNITGLYKGHRSYEKTIMVPTIHINNIANQHQQIDYLKLDVEGAEEDIILSMNEETIKKLYQISMEIHSNVNKNQIIEKLTNHGFVIGMDEGDELYLFK